MLQSLGTHVRNCLERAADARQRAEETSDSGLKADYLFLEKNWTNLAKSFEFAVRLERFLLDYNPANKGNWNDIATAPIGIDLELAIFTPQDAHLLAFPSRRVADGWVDADTKQRIDLQPTHWREWSKGASSDWQPISTAPTGSDLEVAVIERAIPHALIFPCRRTEDGWISGETGERINVHPTHWRKWPS
jgi:hypothetical protein